MEQGIALSTRLTKEMRDLELCLELKEQEWTQREQKEAKKNEEIISNLTNEISHLGIRSSSIEKDFHNFQEEVQKIFRYYRSEFILTQILGSIKGSDIEAGI